MSHMQKELDQKELEKSKLQINLEKVIIIKYIKFKLFLVVI